MSKTDTEADISCESLSSSEEIVVVVKKKKLEKNILKCKKKTSSEESDSDSDTDLIYEKPKYKKRKCKDKLVQPPSHPEGGVGGPIGAGVGAGAPPAGHPLQVHSFADLEQLAASATHPAKNTSVNVDLSKLTSLVKFIQ